MFNIRAIKLKDVDEVFNHAYQLAMRTGSVSVDFVLTKEKLIEGLFGTKADLYGLVVTENNRIVGSCLYCFVNINRPFNKTGCLFLDMLFVDPASRFKGIGKLLIQEMEQIARNNNIARIEFWCMKDNIASGEFYKNIGAKKLDLVDVYNLDIGM